MYTIYIISNFYCNIKKIFRFRWIMYLSFVEILYRYLTDEFLNDEYVK